MNNIFTVMKFTMTEMIKRKSFIISTIIMLVLIVVGFNVPNILKKIEGDSVKSRILIVDKDNIFEGNLETLKQADLGEEVLINNNVTFDEIKNKIEEEVIDSAIVIEKQDDNVKIRYIVENMAMMSGVPEEIINVINTTYTNIQITKLGLTPEQLQSITPNFEFSLEQTEEEEVHGNVFAMMLMSLALFYAIYFCAYQVSSSITTEKTSKIIETLVTSTSPRTIILGKTIGIGIVGLLQMIVLVGTALISAKAFLDPELIEQILDVTSITPYLAIITIVYFILGYFAYSLLYALTGSTVSKPEDIQSANTPVAFLTLIGFYLSYFTMMNPSSNLNEIAAIVPISSPFCMPFRVMMGISSTNEIILSIVVLVVTILLIAHISIKIYSSAILNYGTKMSLKDIVKIYKSKD